MSNQVVALTAEGEKYQAEGRLRDQVCFLSNGQLLIAENDSFTIEVRRFKTMLTRNGVRFNEKLVARSEIIDAYASAANSNASKDEQTASQSDAVNRFRDAVRKHASDVHIYVNERGMTRIHYRIHGQLEQVDTHTGAYGRTFCQTIYNAMCDVADSHFNTMIAQDARISDPAHMPPGVHGIRFASGPTDEGFLVVLRLLYNDTSNSLALTELGYDRGQNNAIELMKRRPTGINIIAGPTGSGKSTTLQRVLSAIIRDTKGRKHVVTVEDPPEYPINGANQMPVANAETEGERAVKFQQAIRAAMRLDPDVMMIGEMRDESSARLALRAAMTGHAVWTTVHANSAFAVLDRLRDMGLEMDLLTDPSLVTGLICQRLLPVLCEHCKVPLVDVIDRYSQADIDRLSKLGNLEHFHITGQGCDCCDHRGVSGRTAAVETVTTDLVLMDALRRGDKQGAIRHWREKQGGVSMLEHAISKVKAGIVDPFAAEEMVGPLMMGEIEADFIIEQSEVDRAVA